jgi:hypothetical protein
MALLFTRDPSPQLLLVLLFAESAKDGAPDHWGQGKKDSPLPFALLGFHHLKWTAGPSHTRDDMVETWPGMDDLQWRCFIFWIVLAVVHGRRRFSRHLVPEQRA